MGFGACMILRCKGICYRFAAKKPLDGFRFLAGQRPCSVCGIFVEAGTSAMLRCPCCNNKLRLKSRNSKSRRNRLGIICRSIANLMELQGKKEKFSPTLK